MQLISSTVCNPLQAINFWQTLVMNDEHTERRYLLFFLLSWGLPALVIIILVIVLLAGYGWSIHDVYGLVHGDLCPLLLLTDRFCQTNTAHYMNTLSWHGREAIGPS